MQSASCHRCYWDGPQFVSEMHCLLCLKLIVSSLLLSLTVCRLWLFLQQKDYARWNMEQILLLTEVSVMTTVSLHLI